jgi:hypothetical protein
MPLEAPVISAVVQGAGGMSGTVSGRIGRVRRLLRLGRYALPLPLSRGALAVWAYRNRHELARWARFAQQAPGKLAGPATRSDLVTEARLQAALAGDPRTRNVRGLTVGVQDGVAFIAATEPAAELAALAVAERTPGVRRVELASKASTSPSGRTPA